MCECDRRLNGTYDDVAGKLDTDFIPSNCATTQRTQAIQKQGAVSLGRSEEIRSLRPSEYSKLVHETDDPGYLEVSRGLFPRHIQEEMYPPIFPAKFQIPQLTQTDVEVWVLVKWVGMGEWIDGLLSSKFKHTFSRRTVQVR